MIRTALTVLGVLAALILAQAARAQTVPTVALAVQDECYVGDSIPLRIQIENASSAAPPDIESLLGRDWIVQYVGAQPNSSTMTMIINGRVQEQRSQSVTLNYMLSPQRAGEFTIPSIEVQAQGRKLLTKAARVKVMEPTAAQGLGTAIEPSRAYIGQGIKLSVSWVLATAAEDAVLNLNLPPDTFTVHPLSPPGSQTDAGGGARQLVDVDFIEGVGANSGKVRGSLTQASIDGENRVRFSAEFLLVPRKAGRVECGAVRVDFRAVVGQKERTIFDAPWERKTITQRRFARAPAKAVEVIDLPAAGRPPNFSGLVGQFELDAECQPRQAAVGDPLNLNLVLRGRVPLFDPPTMDLNRQRSGAGALAELFRVPRDPLLPQVAENAAIYSTQIRPRTAGVTEVPPVEVAYFDPVEGAYRVARSNRIPLKIAPAAVVGLGALESLADDDGGSNRIAESAEAAAASKPEKIDGLFPPIGPAVVISTVQPERQATSGWSVAIGVIAVPAALWCTGSVFAARRRLAARDPAAWRRRGSLRRAERCLNRLSSDDPAAVSRIVRAFISDWFDLPPDAVTSGDAASAVQQVDPVLASRTRAILDSCDRRLFSPEAAIAAGSCSAAEARALVREIARVPRAARRSSAPQGGAA